MLFLFAIPVFLIVLCLLPIIIPILVLGLVFIVYKVFKYKINRVFNFISSIIGILLIPTIILLGFTIAQYVINTTSELISPPLEKIDDTPQTTKTT